MKNREVMITGVILGLLLIASVSALQENEDDRTNFGHSIRINSINTPDLAPGESGLLNISIKNNGGYKITDLRAKLTLPSSLYFLDDIDEVRVSEIKSEEIKEISYRVIASPTASEGIYSGILKIKYINNFLANYVNVGQEKEDNYTFGIVIKSKPSLFVQIDSLDIYKEKMNGEVSLKFVNNGTSDIKFLTVTLENSENYEIISSDKYYIGDLDSDDYQSVVFDIKVKNKLEKVMLPLKISYRDSLNKYYSETVNAEFQIRKGSEIGKGNGMSTSSILLILVILAIVGYVSYKKFFKKKKKVF